MLQRKRAVRQRSESDTVEFRGIRLRMHSSQSSLNDETAANYSQMCPRYIFFSLEPGDRGV